MSKPNDDVILFKSIYFTCESEMAVAVNIVVNIQNCKSDSIKYFVL